jgi:ectoine hydroxylase-related dioxygenase (phytanoyl-CoA dioxygenase family)
VSWHQDPTYWGLEPVEGVVSIWLALAPATVESGAMR